MTGTTTTTIAIDVMSGDHGPQSTVPASKYFLKRNQDVKIALVGDEALIKKELGKLDSEICSRIDIHHTTEVVGMDESPVHAMKKKKDSSMRVAINLVKEGTAQACVSAGNTGALMATSRFVLKTLPGIDRPAIITSLPSLRGHIHMLDLGANIDSPPELLLQFAVMGSILVKTIENNLKPAVALLNIGVEDIKGNDVIKQTAELMKQSNLNYKGFVEGDSIYTGDVDVIVCDGFVGNVALKTSEGLAQLISQIMKEEFKSNALRKIAAIVAWPVVRAMKKRVDHRRYNGATLIGLNGTVVKSHGGADRLAFAHAIDKAYLEANSNLPKRISEELTFWLGQK